MNRTKPAQCARSTAHSQIRTRARATRAWLLALSTRQPRLTSMNRKPAGTPAGFFFVVRVAGKDVECNANSDRVALALALKCKSAAWHPRINSHVVEANHGGAVERRLLNRQPDRADQLPVLPVVHRRVGA